MKNLLHQVMKFFASGKFTKNEEAASIIRRFVSGTGEPYEWDDFETVNEENPEVDLAIRLCWYYATRYPAKTSTEYCDNMARNYFLRIADALENGAFRNLNYDNIKEALKAKELPGNIASILQS